MRNTLNLFVDFIAMPNRRSGLHCFWVRAHEGADAPLVAIWVDSSARNRQDGFRKAGATRRNDSLGEAESLDAGPEHCSRRKLVWRFARAAAALAFLLLLPGAYAQTTGKISGVVRDQSQGVIAGATVTLVNSATGATQTVLAGTDGAYTVPVLPVGQYDITVTYPGFRPFRRTGVVIDVGSAVVIDVTLQLGDQSQTITVTTESAPQVETTDTQLGEVIAGKQVAEIPLNGRSYTDLFALQVGVTPLTTSAGSNSSSGGAFGSLPAAGNDNTGQFSIHGQRESANGFTLNGVSVQESIGQQAGIIPNLDSIAEFRILTSNTDAEYGNYSGGLINVVTKSGSKVLHGSAFEFLRNTELDSRNFFSSRRAVFQQNQYGGTVGAPIKQNRLFFFGDYQGQRTSQGQDTGLVAVPTLANRGGNFFDPNPKDANPLPGTVNGTFLAQTLGKLLGYTIQPQEPFYISASSSNPSGCTLNTQCVFPNAVIPFRAFARPATKLLPYIPSPNSGTSLYENSSDKLRVHDEKFSTRVDLNTNTFGNFSGYYFGDVYTVDNPYPSGFGGATVPGPNGPFDAISDGFDQLFTVSQTKAFGTTAVNEARIGYVRLNNNLGRPEGGLGVSLADQGISSGPLGIQQGYPKFAGVEMLYFNSFALGANPFFLAQANNTIDTAETVSKVAGNHTFKAGGQYLWYRVTQIPDLVANGSFSFFGSGAQSTGNGFADFLLGMPDFYSQQSSPPFHEFSATGGIFVEDSWRVTPNLTINYGIRWDYIRGWSERNNQGTTLIPGVESQTFPGAPLGYVVPGDSLPNGHTLPSTIAPTPLDNFSPRFGLAYSPGWSKGILGALTGGPGKSSIRLGAGRFFTAIEGLTIAYPTGNPPYGLTYTSPEPPEFAMPFVGAITGTQFTQQFPVQVPAYGHSPSNPDPNVPWSRYTPINGAISYFYRNRTPYAMTYDLTIERQFRSSMLVSASYIGSLGRHLLTVVGANPGIPAVCLSLSQTQDIASGTPLCGPFGENGVYRRANGTIVNGTRAPFDNSIGSDGYFANMGNSNYNGFEFTFKRTTGRLTWLASYTWSKSLDWSSNLQEQVNPFDYRREYGISAFDIRHDFVVSYNYDVPFEKLLRHANRWTEGWSLSGVARIATGLPVTFATLSDNALINIQNNGVNSISIDLPNVAAGSLGINHNPRNGLAYFNTRLFAPNALGTQGNSPRRFFYGPGIDNFDMALHKTTHITEGKSLELRFETFNTLNHAQFYGASAVDANISSQTFGHVLHAAPPRIGQVALKLSF